MSRVQTLFAEMPVIAEIRAHAIYRFQMGRLAACEERRVFCTHGPDHLASVARIAYIHVLEQGISYRKDVVYAAAFLHDIGKADQYHHGTPHEEAGARYAQEILEGIDVFTADEKDAIVTAVREHRRFSEDSSELGRILYAADKASRLCFDCAARAECSWSDTEKNLEVKI